MAKKPAGCLVLGTHRDTKAKPHLEATNGAGKGLPAGGSVAGASSTAM